MHIFLGSHGGGSEQCSVRRLFAALSPEPRGALTFVPQFAAAVLIVSADPSGLVD